MMSVPFISLAVVLQGLSDVFELGLIACPSPIRSIIIIYYLVLGNSYPAQRAYHPWTTIRPALYPILIYRSTDSFKLVYVYNTEMTCNCGSHRQSLFSLSMSLDSR
ncbi:hypothetical protein BDV26DRAFT_65882 [Aspergillus bertholletiae]|uniref:Uncharacterized protein n=1 Tax=Aspergillus bertholletiae TaxID=1226010 RepID=A0A5N7AUI5_9EURO|nr:hypothetical protein BDV26DRAFT_65882 [Aspergillus bertholletiae]